MSADRSARISALVRQEAGRLLDYFLRRCASAEDAADLLGETLLVVWRRERAVPEDATRARMWLFGVARKVLSSQRRGRDRRSALTARLGAELKTAQGGVWPEPDWIAIEVRALLRRLDETDQELIRLVYWDGFALNEAAEILRMRASTARSRNARAKARLRVMLLEAGLIEQEDDADAQIRLFSRA